MGLDAALPSSAKPRIAHVLELHVDIYWFSRHDGSLMSTASTWPPIPAAAGLETVLASLMAYLAPLTTVLDDGIVVGEMSRRPPRWSCSVAAVARL